MSSWIDPKVFKHRAIDWKVRFHDYALVWEHPRWIEPDGQQQLHFPRTRWIRDGPDPSLEDHEGDIEMVLVDHDGDIEMTDA